MLSDTLRQSVASLTTSIDNLAARQPAPTPPPVVTGGSVSDTDVQTAVDAIDAQTKRLDTLVNPIPPAASSTSTSVDVPASVAGTDFANPIK